MIVLIGVWALWHLEPCEGESKTRQRGFCALVVNKAGLRSHDDQLQKGRCSFANPLVFFLFVPFT